MPLRLLNDTAPFSDRFVLQTCTGRKFHKPPPHMPLLRGSLQASSGQLLGMIDGVSRAVGAWHKDMVVVVVFRMPPLPVPRPAPASA